MKIKIAMLIAHMFSRQSIWIFKKSTSVQALWIQHNSLLHFFKYKLSTFHSNAPHTLEHPLNCVGSISSFPGYVQRFYGYLSRFLKFQCLHCIPFDWLSSPIFDSSGRQSWIMASPRLISVDFEVYGHVQGTRTEMCFCLLTIDFQAFSSGR